MLDLFQGFAAKVAHLDHLFLGLVREVFDGVDIRALQAVEAAHGEIQLLDRHLHDGVRALRLLLHHRAAVADRVRQIGEEREEIAQDLGAEAQRVARRDGLVGPDLDGQLVKVRLVAHTGVLDSVVDLQDRRVDAVHRDGPDDLLRTLVLVRRDVASAVGERDLHGERAVRAEAGNVQLGVEDLDLAVCLDVAGSDFTLACRFDIDGLGTVAVQARDDALHIQHDLRDVFLDAGDRRKLVLHTGDPDGRRGRAGQ